jgi:hypothetical protein
MATVERRNDRFRLIFYQAGKRYAASLKITSQREAADDPHAIRVQGSLLQAVGLGAMEANSLDTVKMHLRNFVGSLGAHFPIQTLKLDHLQEHIERRAVPGACRPPGWRLVLRLFGRSVLEQQGRELVQVMPPVDPGVTSAADVQLIFDLAPR